MASRQTSSVFLRGTTAQTGPTTGLERAHTICLARRHFSWKYDGNMYSRDFKAPKESFFLFGPRGCGKSQWLRNHFSDSAYFDLLDEDLFTQFARNPSLLKDRLRRIDKKKWIVIDEVQRIPNLLNEVHRSIESDRRKFVLCGSSARKLRQRGVNLLAGRALEKHMHPFTHSELGPDFDLPEILRFGAIPIVWDSENKTEKLKAYVQTYLKQEIQLEALTRNLPGFLRFLPVAAVFHGQTINVSSVARDAGVSRTTVSGYVDILIDTLIAFKLEAYSSSLKIREIKHPKLYIVDPGVVRQLKSQSGEVGLEEIGPLYEGWIAQQLRAYHDYFNIYDSIHYWSAHGREAEVDFLIKQGSHLIAVEVKASKSFHKEHLKGLKAIEALPKVKRRILVYQGRDELETDSGIEVLPTESFLNLIKQGF